MGNVLKPEHIILKVSHFHESDTIGKVVERLRNRKEKKSRNENVVAELQRRSVNIHSFIEVYIRSILLAMKPFCNRSKSVVLS